MPTKSAITALTATTLLSLTPAVTAWADAPAGKGANNAMETTDKTGQPDSVGTASQFALALKDAGSSRLTLPPKGTVEPPPRRAGPPRPQPTPLRRH
ncbi:MAG: hypothetical protein QG671_1866 [Actinomycetota bacterium]|nr:hypothetical protein [Actinomycetota bacterium]